MLGGRTGERWVVCDCRIVVEAGSIWLGVEADSVVVGDGVTARGPGQGDIALLVVC